MVDVVSEEPPAAAAPRSIVADLALDVHPDDRFVAGGGPEGGRMFGGLLIAQALAAATATVPTDRRPHALHASFLRAGAGGEPVGHRVERTRDGRSFSTRRVVSDQRGDAVLAVTVEFQVDESGPEYDLDTGTPLPGPDGLPIGRYDTGWFESRDVPADLPGRPPHARAAWYRARAPLPPDPGAHLLALAMMSDHGPTRAARQPHLADVDVERRFSVSLDHAVWFHRPARVDEWLCSELVPVATGGGRGLTFGTIRTADGTIVASVAQESTLRFG